MISRAAIEATAFPAHAGMNRSSTARRSPSWSVPRTRGDEPALLKAIASPAFAFPAHAGMNRSSGNGL